MVSNMSVKKNGISTCIPGRIDWCDVFKGILIILVVIGHSTEKFNQFIYQFHMSAFFFISEYTSQPRKTSFFNEIIKKFYRLMVPYYVINLAGIVLFYLFDKIEVLDRISTTVYPDSFQSALYGLLSNTVVYCDWLGAMWFLPVMFGASLVFHIIINICNRKYSILAISIFVFLLSEYLIKKGIYWGNKDLVGLAQFFLVIGYLAKDIKIKMNGIISKISVALVLMGVWKISIYLGFVYRVDWPSRKFNGIIDFLLPVYGIAFVVVVSMIIICFPKLKHFFPISGKEAWQYYAFILLDLK